MFAVGDFFTFETFPVAESLVKVLQLNLAHGHLRYVGNTLWQPMMRIRIMVMLIRHYGCIIIFLLKKL
jgi:hypothetical protein